MDEREEIKGRLDVAELISSYIQTKPAGRSFKAVCPFHNEKTPSLMINPEKGIWHCFGCHKGGDVFSFVMEIEGITFPEALQKLADRAGVTLTERKSNKDSLKKDRLLEINQLAAKYFTAAMKTPAGKIAKEYLVERKVAPDTIEKFQVGVSPSAWDALTQFLLKKDFKEAELIQAGVTTKGRRGPVDRFRGRLIFPIKNASGQIVGFGGRLLDPKQTGAKYLNSSESLIYYKSDILYGFDLARDAIRADQRAVVVEGYFDVIMSHQVGVTNVVASSGTALTQQQLRRLSRLTKTILIAFDPDDAGREATQRAIELGSELGLSLYVIETPQGQDPADLALADPAAWKKLTEGGTYVMDYLFTKTFETISAASAPGKRQAAARLTPFISLISDPIEQAHYVKQLAQRLSIGEQDVRAAVRQTGAGDAPVKVADDPEEPAVTPEDLRGPVTEARLLGLILSRPEYIAPVVTSLEAEALSDPRYKSLYTQLQKTYNDSPKDHSWDPGALPSELQETAHFLILSADFVGTDDTARVEDEVLFCVKRLREDYFHYLQGQLEQALRQAEGRKDKQKEQEILAKLNRVLHERKRPISLD